jgi:hypothetical protein
VLQHRLERESLERLETSGSIPRKFTRTTQRLFVETTLVVALPTHPKCAQTQHPPLLLLDPVSHGVLEIDQHRVRHDFSRFSDHFRSFGMRIKRFKKFDF